MHLILTLYLRMTWRQIEYCYLLRMTPFGVIWMS